MASAMWCPRCDLIATDGKECACGSKLYKVAHAVDTTELLLTALTVSGLLSRPDGFDPSAWNLQAIQDDLDARDDIITAAEALAFAEKFEA